MFAGVVDNTGQLYRGAGGGLADLVSDNRLGANEVQRGRGRASALFVVLGRCVEGEVSCEC